MVFHCRIHRVVGSKLDIVECCSFFNVNLGGRPRCEFFNIVQHLLLGFDLCIFFVFRAERERSVSIECSDTVALTALLESQSRPCEDPVDGKDSTSDGTTESNQTVPDESIEWSHQLLHDNCGPSRMRPIDEQSICGAANEEAIEAKGGELENDRTVGNGGSDPFLSRLLDSLVVIGGLSSSDRTVVISDRIHREEKRIKFVRRLRKMH